MDQAIESLQEQIGYNPIRARLMRLYLGKMRGLILEDPRKAIEVIDQTIKDLDLLEGR